MKPLGAIAVGLVLVFVDLRLNSFDIVPDTLGWVIAAIAVARLRGRHGSFSVAFAFAVAAAATSLVALAIPATPGTGIAVVEQLADLGFAFSLCTGLMAIAISHDPATARSANTIRWLDVATTAVAAPLMFLAARSFPNSVPLGVDAGALTPIIVVLIVVGLGVRLWTLVLLWSRQDREYAAP